MRWWCLIVLLGCEDPASDGATCEEAALALQCPPGSMPLVGAQARDLCAAGVEVVGTEGEITGRCLSEQSCQVVCRFDDPCRCGVDRITEEGVFCTPCEGALACGDGICAGGEDPATCPEDCGPRCAAGQQRCNGVLREECSLQGRYERLACPAGEVCVEVAADRVDCRPEGVVQVDAGPNPTDGAMENPWIAGGRARRGPGTWPGSSDGVGPATGPMRFRFQATLTQGVTYVPGGVVAAALGPTADELLVCGAADCQRFVGWAQPAPIEEYCGVYSDCYPEYAAACLDTVLVDQPISQLLNYAFGYAGGLLYGAPVQACVLDALRQGGECAPDLRALGCPRPGAVALQPGGIVTSWTFSPGGRFGAALHQQPDGRIELIWGPLDGSAPRAQTLGQTTLVFADVNDAGALAAVLFDGAGQILLTATPEGAPRFTPLDEGGVVQVALSPSGRVAALVGTGNLVRFWNLLELQEILRIRDAVWPVVFSPVDGVVALHFTDGDAELWDLVAIEKQGELPGTRGGPYGALAFHPSGASLVTASAAGINFWEADTRVRTAQDAIDPRYLQGVFNARWSADGQGVVVQLPYRLLDPTVQPLYRFYGVE